ncbi:hypothetical protein NW77_014 [Erwinia phage phiEa2809]|uniref:Uncharacterized protein n=1 Tax=Erwinia phage phiEa2809 TaxID=1564096 RepID=A0A0A0YR00_9CAUD|nr:hypothetical protein NW77_014 [Erwinia phage phiEa2809]AIX13022.1 hypothetical protein NW77_014 [Erwinia phage phiEa2809]
MSPFFEAWFFWSGIVLNGAAIVAIAWFINMAVIWPAVEATSLTRCTVKALGKDRVSHVLFIWWCSYRDCFGGRNWECVSTNLFTWYGVGNYTISKEDDNE